MPTVALQLVYRRAAVDQAMNVLHFQVQPSPSPAQAQPLCDLLTEAVTDAFTGSDYRGMMATNWSLNRCQLRPSHDTSFPPVSAPVGTSGLAGTGSGDAQSALIAMAVSLWGAEGRPGRIFLPGWDEVVNHTTGRPAAGTSAAAVQFAERLLTEFTAITFEEPFEPVWVIHRRQLDPPVDGRPFNTAITTVLRSSSSASGGWQTQRRRRFAIQAEE